VLIILGVALLLGEFFYPTFSSILNQCFFTLSFIDTSSTKSPQLQEQFKIHPNLDTLLLFNEDKARPVASISMTDIPSQTLNNVISNNQYLALPRLSSQEILEGVCPADFNRPKKKLCVVLITENSYSHDFAREALRRMSMQSSYKERVRYAYIFREKQSDFINALSVNSGSTDTLLKLVVIWRRDNRHIKYEWVNDSTLHLIKDQENITSDVNFNVTKLKIDEVVQRLLRTSEALPYEAEVKVRFSRK
jgi:DnaJ family protein C protein 16